MLTGFVVFTLLWAISCTSLYFLLMRKVEATDKLYDEGLAFHKKAAEAYERAIRANSEAIRANEAANKRLCQIQNSLTCLN